MQLGDFGDLLADAEVGVQAVIGSWKIIAMRSPANRAESRSASPTSSRPSSDRAARAASARTRQEAQDAQRRHAFPQPDSPTMATRLAARRDSESTPRTGLQRPRPAAGSRRERPSTLEHGVQSWLRSCPPAAVTSRSASPSEVDREDQQRPGRRPARRSSQGRKNSWSFPSAIISPQDAFGSWTPTPRKDSAASRRMAWASRSRRPRSAGR